MQIHIRFLLAVSATCIQERRTVLHVIYTYDSISYPRCLAFYPYHICRLRKLRPLFTTSHATSLPSVRQAIHTDPRTRPSVRAKIRVSMGKMYSSKDLWQGEITVGLASHCPCITYCGIFTYELRI